MRRWIAGPEAESTSRTSAAGAASSRSSSSHWLAAPAGAAWLDVGCGTGALTATIVARAAPASVVGDRPLGRLRRPRLRARRTTAGSSSSSADAAALPLTGTRADVVASGLLLNFLPDPDAAMRELRRVARPGAAVAAYVWDYADGMQPIRAFWDAAIAIEPSAREADEAVRFPLCTPDRLTALRRRRPARRRNARDRRRGGVSRLRRLLDAVPERRRPSARVLRGPAGGSARGAACATARAALTGRWAVQHERPRVRGARDRAARRRVTLSRTGIRSTRRPIKPLVVRADSKCMQRRSSWRRSIWDLAGSWSARTWSARWVIAFAIILTAAIGVVRVIDSSPADSPGVLLIVPVAVCAVRFGLRGGVASATVGLGLATAVTLATDGALSGWGIARAPPRCSSSAGSSGASSIAGASSSRTSRRARKRRIRCGC